MSQGTMDWLISRPGDWAAHGHRSTPASRAQVLELAVSLSRPIPGHIVEFGVFQGQSTRVIRDELWRSAIWDRRQRRKRIYACDSFQGLAKHYEHLPAGTFATSVPRLAGVRIVTGFFEDSLTPALAAQVGQVSMEAYSRALIDRPLGVST